MEKPVDKDLEFLLDLASFFYGEGFLDAMIDNDQENAPTRDILLNWLENRSK